MKKYLLIITFSSLAIFAFVVRASGNINPPVGAPTASFFTLSQIYNFITSNTVAIEGNHDFSFSDSLTPSGKTLTEVYNALTNLISADKVKSDITYLGVAGTLVPQGGDATEDTVLLGKTFFGNAQTDWNLKTGTYDITNIADGAMVKLGTTYGTSSVGALIPTLDDTVGAESANVLEGKIFYGKGQTDWTPQNGTMVNQTILGDFSPTSSDIPILAGFYDGNTKILGDVDLISDNIKSGVSIFGISGSSSVVDTADADAVEGEIFSGKSAYVNGNKITGTMVNNPQFGDNDASQVLNTASNPGTYDIATCATTYNTTNLSAGTIKNGIAFGNGMTGEYPSISYPLPDNTDTNASASHILSGYEAWDKAGLHILGAMPTRNLSDLSETVAEGYYSATTLSAIDSDLKAENIRNGTNIFGVAGNLTPLDTSDATASVGDINTGKTAYVNGVKLTGTGILAIGDAINSNVLAGKYFSNSSTSNILGTMPNKVGSATIFTPSTVDQAITAGYYGGATGDGKVLGDTDLITGNIKSGINIFGVSGTVSVVNTADGTAVASDILSTKTAYVNGVLLTGSMVARGLPKSGQTSCWNTDGTVQNPCLAGDQADGGQDGYYQKGMTSAFVDNSNNTITDNTTGLMWKKCSEGLSGATCATGSASSLTWRQGLSACEADTTAGYTDWRLPNRLELSTIVNLQNASPAINTTYFPATQSSSYWSSSTNQLPGSQSNAWYVSFNNGSMSTPYTKTSSNYVRCVR